MSIRLSRLLREIRRRKEVGIGLLVLVLVVSIIGNALTFFVFDRSAQPDITMSDAFWYSIISITTIGYGDFSATTLGARIGTAVFVILFGLTAFTSAVGIGVEWVVDRQHKERTGMGRTNARHHLLIINFPNERRVRQIIEEFAHDARHKQDDFVIVSDQIETLPFALPNVTFIRGSPIEEETYVRANVMSASQAIILSTGYDDPNSDSVAASIVSILEHLNPDIRSIAECLNANHSLLFKGSKNVSLVYTFRISNNLIVQEAQDPGVNLLTNAITSNQIEGTLISTKVEGSVDTSLAYRDIAKKLLDNDINLVGVIRDGDVHVIFDNLALVENDLIVYVSIERHDWQDIRSLLAR